MNKDIETHLEQAEYKINNGTTLIPVKTLEEIKDRFLEIAREIHDGGEWMYEIDIVHDTYERLYKEIGINKHTERGYEILIYITKWQTERMGKGNEKSNDQR